MNKVLADKAAQLKYLGQTSVMGHILQKKTVEGIDLYIIQAEPIVVKLTAEDAVAESAAMQKHGNWLKIPAKGINNLGKAMIKAGTAMEAKTRK